MLGIMALYARLTKEIRQGPMGSKVGAFFDLDQTIMAGFSATSFMRERFLSGRMSPQEMVGTFAGALSFGLGRTSFSALMSGMTAILFLGGWLPPFDIAPFNWIPGPIWFFLKIAFLLFVFVWVRATLPRYRYDQLMRLGWKVFLPFSLLWVALTAGVLVAFDMVPNT